MPKILLLFLCFTFVLRAQIPEGDYLATVEKDGKEIRFELKIHQNYLIISQFETNPANFIKTLGGFYSDKNNLLKVQLEFNSNFEMDGIKELDLPFTYNEGILKLHYGEPLKFVGMPKLQQDLDGLWLFATRGPDTGQERRGDENPRKTLKFLIDGYFQWVAYNTDTLQFFGTGGGTYTAKDGVYTENIAYFSRDNARVGASLKFDYELKGGDWHHTGENSKGEPMYEIWAKRDVQ
ncbi:MAG: hypothetical protein MUO53_10215 [Maribacter sp.]|nr:hypothetical protein [Maribacter sp.]